MPLPVLSKRRSRRPLRTLAALGLTLASAAVLGAGSPEAVRPWRLYAATALPSVSTAHIGPAALAIERDPYSQPPRESAILFVRQPDGRLDAWFLPVREGQWRLPVDAEWNPGLPCARFGADFVLAAITCDDPRLDPELRVRYRWSLDGRRRSEFVPDLLRVPGSEEAGSFILHKRAA